VTHREVHDNVHEASELKRNQGRKPVVIGQHAAR
jgi:hypothetical protein